LFSFVTKLVLRICVVNLTTRRACSDGLGEALILELSELEGETEGLSDELGETEGLSDDEGL